MPDLVMPKPGQFNCTCTLCGTLWEKSVPKPPGCSHTEAEWETYRASKSLTGVWPRWNVVELPKADEDEP